MTLALENMRHALEGLVPTAIATSSVDGTPNVTYLSYVEYLDCKRVALSCQFFNKTKQNIEANPYACLFLHDPATLNAYRMRLRYDHAEKAGPLFDRMAARIHAIATHTGMVGIFKLLSADVYEVESIEEIEGFMTPVTETPVLPETPAQPKSELLGLQQVSDLIARADDLGKLLGDLLAVMEQAFDFQHAMLLLPDESHERLFTVASRGYGESGVGSEVKFGEGLIGACAQERVLLRLSVVDEDLRYGRAIRDRARAAGATRSIPEVPLPGLPDAQSQLAIPLLVRDQLVGVLAVESRAPMSFDEWHEAVLRIIGNQVAIGIQNLSRRDDEDEPTRTRTEPKRSSEARRTRRFRFYPADDCVFVDDEYLVRNIPGRILWRVLRIWAESGRTEFSNRELRLDESMGLPAIRDNLEARLVLLRKRLEERCPDVRIARTGRGRFSLEIHCEVVFEE